MAENNNILQNIARGYRKALQPVFDASGSPEESKRLQQVLGKSSDTAARRDTPATPNIPAGTEERADNFLTKNPSDFTKDDWKDVLSELKNVYKALKDFIGQTDFSSGWDIADEATFFLIQVLTSDFVFKNYPQFYTTADALGLAQDQVLGIRGLKDTLADWSKSTADRFFPDLREQIAADTGVSEQHLDEIDLREAIRSLKRLVDDNNPNVGGVFGYYMDLTDLEVNAIPNLKEKITQWHTLLETGTTQELQRSMRMLTILPYATMQLLSSLAGVEGGKTFGVSFGSEAETGDPELDALVRRVLTLFLHFDNPTTEGEVVSGETFAISFTNAPENKLLRDGYVLSFRGAGGLKIPLENGYVVDINLSSQDTTFGFSTHAHPALKGLKTIDGEAAYVMTRFSNEQPGGIYRLGDADASNVSFDTWALELRGNMHDISLRATARFSLQLAKEADSDNFLKKHLLKDGVRKELEVGLGMSLLGGIFVTLGNSAPFFLVKPKPAPPPPQPEENRRAALRGRDAAPPPAVATTFDKELTYKLNKTIGPLRLDDLFVVLQAKFTDREAAASVSAGLNFGLRIGPVSAAVEGMGLRLKVVAPTEAPPESAPEPNLGIADLDLDFKPPVGIALAISAKAVEGAGYIRFEPERGIYTGALSLNIKKKITLGAVCILHTKVPEIPGGYSFLILVNTTFQPGIQLGFGFSMQGLGGILGLHRTISVERIRADMTSGSLERILFPEIDALNVRQLVQQLDHYFPAKADQFFGGLMTRIVWGAPAVLIMDVGLILEGPKPWRLVLLGMIRATLPNPDKPVLVLRCAVLGEIDFDKGFLALDARLYGSRLLGFDLQGDVAIRLRWLGDSGFLLSAGGFHPDFRPPAHLNPGSLTRITFRLADIDNPELVLTAYFAVTSNTVQFGARADAKAKLGNVGIEGYLYFDALFQFSPFRMIVALGGGVAVSYRGYDLLSIKVAGTLAGPGPWNIHLTLSFSVWWWDVDVDYSKTWGQEIADPQLAVAVLPLVKDALAQPGNWTAPTPSARFEGVRLREQTSAADKVMVQPIGLLRISQTVAPLGRALDKFGNHAVADIRNVDISKIEVSGQPVADGHDQIEEDFAPSLFRDMSEEERLRAKSFEKGTGGLALQDEALRTSFSFSTDSSYELYISDTVPVSEQEKAAQPQKHDWPQRTLQSLKPVQVSAMLPANADQAMVDFLVKNGQIARSPLSKENRLKRLVLPGKTAVIQPERFVIAETEHLQSSPQFGNGSQTDAEITLRKMVQAQPQLKGKLQVLPEYALT